MLTESEFDRITYRFPRSQDKTPEIDTLLGIDSESFTSGKPFLICLSNGCHFHPRNLLKFLFNPHNRNHHYAAYNLKYDSGSLLYFIPASVKIDLWKIGRAQYREFSFQYIPHKYLCIRNDEEDFVKIWDISQFFKMSLDAAAHKYLNARKIKVPTKSFTPDYWKHHKRSIITYCTRDADLTAKLANFLVSKFKEFGIRTTALYSAASLSYRYYSDNAKINTSWRYWKYHRNLMRFAQESYQGGKFEITARGSFTGYEYDITSAYPYEIANLVDITTAEVIHSKAYRNDAIYGYLRVHVENPKGIPVPCGLMLKHVVVYPAGSFYTTITKQEYDYLISKGLDVEILDGYWLAVSKISYPYREVTNSLFDLKSYYKKKDPTLSYVAKTMANSFYGKTIQLIPTHDGTIIAGTGWNPMHASVITANTRIKVTEMQSRYQKSCIAVHTDSVMLLEPLDSSYITNTLGGFELKTKGSSLIVACGQYDLGDKSAFKGFVPTGPKSQRSWRYILSKHANQSSFRYPILRVQSWVDAASKANFSKVNYFERTHKVIDLNVDSKRSWPYVANSNTLLNTLQYSTPMIVVHTERPKIWNEPLEE